jgi:hypothetical protein
MLSLGHGSDEEWRKIKVSSAYWITGQGAFRMRGCEREEDSVGWWRRRRRTSATIINR